MSEHGEVEEGEDEMISGDFAACTAYPKDDGEPCPVRYGCQRFEASFNKVPWQAFMETPEFGEEGCEWRMSK